MLKLYDYFRSSASFRVRIALNYKGLDYDKLPIDLRHGVQTQSAYTDINPSGLVPTLITDEQQPIHQSLAIMAYLEESHPGNPLLPPRGNALDRAYVRSIAMDIIFDIHPLNNLRVWNYMVQEFKITEVQKMEWYRHWVAGGLKALEKFVVQSGKSGQYLYGDQFTLADICLVAQIFNAKRFELDLTPYPTLCAINDRCCKLDAVIKAWPNE